MGRLASGGLWVLVGATAFAGTVAACSAGKDNGGTIAKTDSGTTDDETGFDLDANGSDSPGPTTEPTTCMEAAAAKSYVGCDYWPTVTANNVWSIFDFAAIVANAGANPADITITGPNGVSITGTVQPGTLEKFYLPWVPALKGPDTDSCGQAVSLPGSVLAKKSAYHLISTSPVTVYQFNALEYGPKGGPASKNWGSCPGTTTTCASYGKPIGCFSYSNDASLLLPSTAMTGNYRVLGQHGWSITDLTGTTQINAAFVTITATANATNVTITAAKAWKIVGGSGVTATVAGGTLKLTLDAGDVVELIGEKLQTSDPSGSLIQANNPIQVITGIPCINQPADKSSCDHTEESVFPYETLGSDYVVTMPTGPKGNTPGHNVRIYGNVNGTVLTYGGAKPASAPNTINAGQVVDLGTVTGDFEVSGTHEFGVASFMLGGTIVDPAPDPSKPYDSKGDPSQSLIVATAQYRTNYVFLAPSDYDVSYVDIVSPTTNSITIDGAAPKSSPKAIAGDWVVYREPLGAGNQGAHTLRSTQPVGIQVVGYGTATSYQYPGGLNLKGITAAPPPPM